MLRAAGKRLLIGAAGTRPFAGAGGSSSSAAAPAVAARRGYHERVVDHYSNPRNVGAFDKDDADVGTGLVGAPACGDVMKMQIRVDQASGQGRTYHPCCPGGCPGFRPADKPYIIRI
jgi:hypothetical protein